jgi:hypothetical protein
LLPQLNSKLFRQRKHSLIRFPNSPGKVVEERLVGVVLLGLHPPTEPPSALVNLDISDAGLDQPERSVQTGYTAANLRGDRNKHTQSTNTNEKRHQPQSEVEFVNWVAFARCNPAKGQSACWVAQSLTPHRLPTHHDNFVMHPL